MCINYAQLITNIVNPSSTQSFCGCISHLFSNFYISNLDDYLQNIFLYYATINLNAFSQLMEYWIESNMEGNLIITLQFGKQ